MGSIGKPELFYLFIHPLNKLFSESAANTLFSQKLISQARKLECSNIKAIGFNYHIDTHKSASLRRLDTVIILAITYMINAYYEQLYPEIIPLRICV